ncbi:hypothetical protein Pint_12727 [Pistacia integerrima]|uniref:Uncharacterized protein n=1 Tax=Pistacia integerrima TaxID=434235 RepID=A0ACC0Y647_9ROSI|nr:hypothetical protein Pint_12727 [Pistacia integerrima]
MDRGENEKRLDELKATIKENEGRLQNLQSTAFQLANYYFVFQGVILTAICNGVTSLRCSDRWFLFTVSLLATILNLVALCIKGLKYLRTKTQQDENWCEYNELEKRGTQVNRDSTNALHFLVAGIFFAGKMIFRSNMGMINVSNFVKVAAGASGSVVNSSFGLVIKIQLKACGGCSIGKCVK